MPEGPEVEVVRRGLLAAKGKKIETVEFANHKKYHNLNPDGFVGSSIREIERFGKYMIWFFHNGIMVLNHLGMTGIWKLISKEKWNGKLSLRHPKVIFKFVDGDWLVFEDTRIFGKFEIINELPKAITKLGPDILKEDFDYTEFLKRVRGNGRRPRKQEIGNLLLDQTVVAGCGNIYKSESLFLAKINPFKKAHQLEDEDLINLANCLISVAKDALENGGSTLRDFSSVEGYSGLMQNEFKVYGREGEPCEACGTEIEKRKQGGRSTFFCPNCQY